MHARTHTCTRTCTHTHRLQASLTGLPESTANMKKESKAYSYEDQKWEVEMRQEILRKKAAESNQSDATTDVRELLKKAKLSQKQKVYC